MNYEDDLKENFSVAKKKVRSSPFSEDEDRVLIEEFSKRRAVLESSTKQGITMAMKSRAWNEIVGSINAVYIYLYNYFIQMLNHSIKFRFHELDGI